MKSFIERENCCFDLETLATRPDAAIVSLGAVKFLFDGTVTDTFKVNIDAASCKSHGLFIDKSTIEWWGTQPKEARSAWMKDPVPLTKAIDSFTEWYGTKSIPTWSHGAAFDIPIIEYIYKKCFNTLPPWKYWDCFCTRTIVNVAGYDLKKEREASGNYHDALEDAKAQALAIVKILNGKN